MIDEENYEQEIRTKMEFARPYLDQSAKFRIAGKRWAQNRAWPSQLETVREILEESKLDNMTMEEWFRQTTYPTTLWEIVAGFLKPSCLGNPAAAWRFWLEAFYELLVCERFPMLHDDEVMLFVEGAVLYLEELDWEVSLEESRYSGLGSSEASRNWFQS